LGYVPTDADEAELMNKSADRMLARPMPHLYQSFSMQEHTIDNGLGEGISGMFEKVDAVMENEGEISGIRDAYPEEQLQNLTSIPVSIPRSSWKKRRIFMFVF